LQFDAYHVARIHGPQAVLPLWEEAAPWVGHVQVAGVPGRAEPAGGPVDWPGFFASVAASGYAGWIGAEYAPRGTVEAGLAWMDAARAGAAGVAAR
jgi:hydroxypyruvate isomerase